MKKHFNFFSLTLITILSLSFTACKKDDPVAEKNLEQIDGTVVNFIEGHFQGTEFHASGDTVKVTFEKDKTVSSPSHVHLHAGETYLMEIDFYYKGVKINSDFDAPSHQFFFVGAPDGVFNYTYADERVGLKGYLTVNQATESGFEWNLILRHGLNKNHAAAQAWNNPNYNQAGGSYDFNRTVEIHPVVGDGQDH